MVTPPLEIHLGDELSLAEFVAFWWADEAPATGDDDEDDEDELKGFLDRKQASLRMLRRNRPGFPKPTGSLGRTRLYRLGDLVSWMPRAGTADKSTLAALEERSVKVSPLWHLRRAVDGCRRELEAESARRLAVAAALALHCLGVRPGLQPAAARRLTSAGEDTVKEVRLEAQALESRIPEIDGVFEQLLKGIPARPGSASRLVRATSSAILGGIPANRVVDLTLRRLAPAPATGGGTALTASGLSRLIVAAGDPQPGERILDLAAGEGSLLLCASAMAGGPTHLAGMEPDPSAWAIAKSRFHLRGLEVDLALAKSLGGGDRSAKADLVMVDPPFEHRRNYHRWLSLAADYTGPMGRAVVALPGVSLETTRREWRLVGMERAGIVVKAPSRLRSDHGDALALWVLDDRPGDQILLVDVSNLGRQRGALNDIGREEAEELRRSVHAWRRAALVESTPPLVAFTVSRAEMGGLRSGRDGVGDENRNERVSYLAVGARFGSDDSSDSSEFSSESSSESSLNESSNPHSDLFERGWLSGGRSAQNDQAVADLNRAVSEAMDLTERLAALVNGPLRSHTSEEHRRALKRLLARLGNHLERDVKGDRVAAESRTPTGDRPGRQGESMGR